ncbi:hypothetical protein ACQPZJ_01790 [Actinoplanes sp. CA-054009]
MRSDDLVPLLLQPSAGPGVGFRQGVIVSWSQETAENVVLVGGTLMSNLPILNTSEAAILAEGDVVGILTAGATWGILGRFTIPGSAEAVSALSALRMQSDTVTSSQDTTNTDPTDLATPGPEVSIVVPSTGRLLVMVSAYVDVVAAASSVTGIVTGSGFMGWQMSGANSLSSGANRSLQAQFRYVSSLSGGLQTEFDMRVGATRAALVQGLTPGLTTITAKYWTSSNTAATFAQRNLTVLAI